MKFFLLPFLLLINNVLFSQKLKPLYKKHDEVVNLKNSPLSYGVLFVEKMKKINGNHNYFLSNNFLKANLKSQEQNYFNIDVKYDLNTDDIIVKLPDKANNYVFFLDKKKVNSFSIDNHHFINTFEKGFLEVLFSDDKISLYKKHLKKAKKEYDKEYIHYSFLKKENFLIKYKGVYFNIKSKRDFIKTMPSFKDKISAYYRQETKLRAINIDLFLLNLCKMINKELVKK